MARSSAYLEASRHSVFYFRIRVPKALRSLIPSATIRRSLQTKCRREAIRRGAVLLEQVEALFTSVGDGKGVDLSALSWAGTVPSPSPQRSIAAQQVAPQSYSYRNHGHR